MFSDQVAGVLTTLLKLHRSVRFIVLHSELGRLALEERGKLFDGMPKDSYQPRVVFMIDLNVERESLGVKFEDTSWAKAVSKKAEGYGLSVDGSLDIEQSKLKIGIIAHKGPFEVGLLDPFIRKLVWQQSSEIIPNTAVVLRFWPAINEKAQPAVGHQMPALLNANVPNEQVAKEFGEWSAVSGDSTSSLFSSQGFILVDTLSKPLTDRQRWEARYSPGLPRYGDASLQRWIWTQNVRDDAQCGYNYVKTLSDTILGEEAPFPFPHMYGTNSSSQMLQ